MQYNYAKFWESIINMDEAKIMKYSKTFFNDEFIPVKENMKCIFLHRMFASMVTGRPWQAIVGFDLDENISGPLDKNVKLRDRRLSGIGVAVTPEEKKVIQQKMREKDYLDAMAVVLSSIKRDILLVLKTNDLLRFIDESIGVRNSSFRTLDALKTTVKYSSNAIYRRKKQLILLRNETSRVSIVFLNIGTPKSTVLLFTPSYWSTLMKWLVTNVRCELMVLMHFFHLRRNVSNI